MSIKMLMALMLFFSYFTSGCFEKSSLVFPETEISKTSALDVVIYNPAPQNISISSIQFSNAEFYSTDKTPFDLKPEERKSLKIYFKPSKVGSSSGLVLVTAKKAGYDIPVQIASVQGKGKKAAAAAPKLVVNPSSFDFSNVKIGETVTTKISISNSGNTDLKVSGISLTGSSTFALTLSPMPKTIAAGQSADASLSFKPSVLGAAEASFKITSNDPAGVQTVTARGVGGGAQMSVSVSEIDFGTLSIGGNLLVKKDVIVKNNGNAPLTISGAVLTPANSSFTTDLPATLTLAPAASKTIVVTFFPPNNVEASYQTSLKFTSNATSPQIGLKGQVVGAQLVVDPTSVNMGTTAIGAAAIEKTFKISNPGKAPLTITANTITNNSSAELSVLPAANVVIQPAGFSLFTLRFTAKQSGLKSFVVSFKSNAYKSTALTVTADVSAPKIALSKTSINFGTIKPNESKSDSVTITNSGATELQIKSMVFSGEGSTNFTYSLEGSPNLAAGATRKLSISYLPKSEGSSNASLTITSNASNGTVKLNLTGNAVAPTTLAAPASIAFEPIFVNEIAKKKIAIRNMGPGKLQLNGALIKGANASAFTVLSYTQDLIAFGSDGYVEIEYLSNSAAVSTAQLSISSNSISGEAIVQLKGTAVNQPVLPPEPKDIAPEIVNNAPADFYSLNKFLFEGTNPIQRGTSASVFVTENVGALIGSVVDSDGEALSAVKVTILDHPEFGSTLSRADGTYNFVVNAGGRLTVNFDRTGFLPIQRTLLTEPGTTVSVPKVYLVKQSSVVSTLNFSGSTAGTQFAIGETIEDLDGIRTPVVAVPAGTKASMLLPNGTRQNLGAISLSVTEFTKGASGLQAMPATLPETSGYTFAAEYSIAEAKAAGAKTVDFDRPVYSYVDNFVGLPTGSVLPNGYYDPSKGLWIPSENGQVIEILSIENGKAKVDTKGDGSADDITPRYEKLYSEKGTKLAPSVSCQLIDALPLKSAPILGGQYAMSRMTIAGSAATVGSGFKVGINISSPNMLTVNAELISPSGAKITLKPYSSRPGVSLITLYPDQSIPSQALSQLNGSALDGTWELRVGTSIYSSATVNSWSLYQKESGINCGNFDDDGDGFNLSAKADGIVADWSNLKSASDFVLVRNLNAPVAMTFAVGTKPTVGNISGTSRVVYVGPATQYYDRSVNLADDAHYSLYTIDNYLSSVKGLTEDELVAIARIYPDAVNKSIWRTPLHHFSIYDHNPSIEIDKDAKKPELDEDQDKADEKACADPGCIIYVESQTLAESVPVQGTPFSLRYSTMQSPGRLKDYTIRTNLTGATIPNSLVSVKLKISGLGMPFERTFEPTPNAKFEYIWDGKDQFGRLVQGRRNAFIELEYVYKATYGTRLASDGVGNDFGSYVGNFLFVPTAGREQTTRSLVSTRRQQVGTPKADSGFGGWSLDAQHHFEIDTSTLVKGDGSRRKIREGKTKSLASLAGSAIATDSNGNVFVSRSIFGGAIYKIDTKGAYTSLTTGGDYPSAGDGGLAINARIEAAADVAVDKKSGNVYFTDTLANSIRVITPDGYVNRVAGNNSEECSENPSGLAIEAAVGRTSTVAVNSQGDVFFAGCAAKVLYRVKRDGHIERIAGSISGVATGDVDGGPAIDASFKQILNLAIGPKDEVFVIDDQDHRIRVIDSNGFIRTFAGTGVAGYTNDGGLAIEARIDSPKSVAFDSSGKVYLVDRNGFIRIVDANGNISTSPMLSSPMFLKDIAFNSRDEIFLLVNSGDVVKIEKSGIQRNTDGTILVADENAVDVYKFDSSGRILSVINSVQGLDYLKYNYDANGNLSSISDVDGQVTSLTRDSAGTVQSISSPYGETTDISYDAEGLLASIQDPANRTLSYEYNQQGLLSRSRDAKGNYSSYEFDSRGLLTSDTDAAGFKKTYGRNYDLNHNDVEAKSPMGRVRKFTSEVTQTGALSRTVTASDGTFTTSIEDANHNQRVINAQGDISTTVSQADPRFGLSASLPRSTNRVTPEGVTAKASLTKTVSLSNDSDFLSLQTLVNQTSYEGLGTYTSSFDRTAKTLTKTTPSGFVSKQSFNSKGRVSKIEVSQFSPLEISYDSTGRVISKTQGNRTQSSAYNAQGRLASETNALGQITRYSYDSVGRINQIQKPDGRLVKMNFDDNDNLLSVTLPKNQVHSYSFDSLNQMLVNLDPSLSGVNSAWNFEYNADRQSSKDTFPNGESFQYGYDSAGRLIQMTTPRGNFAYNYDSATGQLKSLRSPEGNGLSFEWDGSLLTEQTWTGQVNGSISMSYGNQMRLSSELIQGSVAVPYTYTPEGSLKSAGPLNLVYNSSNGLLSESQLGNSNEKFTYNGFGEIISRGVTLDSTSIYSESMTRDALGRITSVSRIANGASENISYSYDASGRLTQTAKSGSATETYSYDANDNRILDSDTVYDAQDRLLRNKDWTFTYNARGYLASKASRTTTLVVNYLYDNLAQLRSVIDNAGLNLNYIYDAQGRQIARMKNGALTRSLLYRDQLRPAAELNPNGSLKSVFVYGSRSHVPEFMDQGGVTFRFVTDYLGSVRMVVNLSTKQVVQSISYDSWGRVLSDTNPGFQPFGYAGGLYDNETGIVRFGARDYDGRIGRWLDKDPIRFRGGMNFYSYAYNDPINYLDSTGLFGLPGAIVGAIAGGVGAAITGGDLKAVLIGAAVGGAIGAINPFQSIATAALGIAARQAVINAAGNAFFNAASSIAGQVVGNYLGGKPPVSNLNWGAVAGAAVAGGASTLANTGAVAKVCGPATQGTIEGLFSGYGEFLGSLTPRQFEKGSSK